jgi:hypothetical protein
MVLGRLEVILTPAYLSNLAESVVPESSAVSWTVGFSDEDQVPYLIFETRGSTRRARVTSPGNGWVSVDIDSGHSYNYFDDDIDPDELRELLVTAVRIARAYVADGVVTRKSESTVCVTIDGEQFLLQLSVLGALRRKFRAFLRLGRPPQ